MRKHAAILLGAFLLASALGAFAPIRVVAATNSGIRWPGPGLRSPRLPLSSLSSAPTAPQIVMPPPCSGGFATVPSPDAANNNHLLATAAVGPNDIWAVGTSNVGQNTPDKTLAEHWNGTSWTIVPTPNPSVYSSDLNAVAAISTNDAWAVGDYIINGTGLVDTFAEHWNGTAWALSPTVNPSTGNYNFLYGITAVSSTDVWAVGATEPPPGTTLFTLVEHWNGTAWSRVAAQDPAAIANLLLSVSSFSPNDMWAVGSETAGAVWQSLAEHWDGTVWSVVTTPPTTTNSQIFGVRALESGHAVGVGYSNYNPDGLSPTPRQGEAWDLQASGTSTPSVHTGPLSGDNALGSVDMSGESVWAVGYSGIGIQSASQSLSSAQTLAIPGMFNPTTHTLTWGTPGTSANPSGSFNFLNAVSAVSPYTYWAAGSDRNVSNVDQTLTENYCALHLAVTAPASVSAGAPFSLTVTAANGVGTTATAYRGTVHFTSTAPGDVLPGDYTFTGVDNGTHTFSGVVLETPCQETVTVSDGPPISVPASATLIVIGGTCQSPAGTAGARGSNQSPAGTPGSRSTGQSPAGTPGPRMPAARLSRDASVMAAGDLPATPEGSVPTSTTRATQRAAPASVADAGAQSRPVSTRAVDNAPTAARATAGAPVEPRTAAPIRQTGNLALIAVIALVVLAASRRRSTPAPES